MFIGTTSSQDDIGTIALFPPLIEVLNIYFLGFINEDINIDGEVTEYTKIADSGNERVQGFCGNCGWQIYARATDKSVFNLRTGFLDQHHLLTPKKHIFGQSKVAWIETISEAKWHVAGPESNEMKP